MSKINEILQRDYLQSRIAWLHSANDDGYANYSEVIDLIEELRPYVELAEVVIGTPEEQIANKMKSIKRESNGSTN